MMHLSRGRSVARVVRVGCCLLLASVASVGPLAANPVHADEGAPRADNRARAQQLFDSALADAEAGNLASACPKFLASQEADPKTSTLLNLASCYEKNGQTASAWGAYREAQGLSRKIARPDWEATARARAEALEPKLLKLTVQVPEASRVAGLVVTRDGAKLGAGELGLAIPVDPGEHVVAASAPGRTSWESKTTVREASNTVTVPVLELVPVAVDTPPPPEPPARPSEPTSWWTPLRTTGVVVGGVGVVGLVTGAVLGLAANGNYDEARGRCADGTRACPASAVSDSDSAYGLATGATVVFVVGAAAVAGGAALVLFSPAPDSKTGLAKPNGASAALHVGPGAIGVHGRW